MNLSRITTIQPPTATATPARVTAPAVASSRAPQVGPLSDSVQAASRNGTVPATHAGLRPLLVSPGGQRHIAPVATTSTQMRATVSDVASQLNPIDPHSLVGEYTSLPGVSNETAQNLAALTHDLFDQQRTPTERFLAARQHSQAAGKLLFSITSIPAVCNLASTMLPASTGVYAAAQRFSISHTGRFMNDLLRVARPIGDTVLLIGDGLHLHQTLHDEHATTGQRVRAGVDVGIDSIRVAHYLLPKTPAVTAAAGAALFARVGLGLYDVTLGSRSRSAH